MNPQPRNAIRKGVRTQSVYDSRDSGLGIRDSGVHGSGFAVTERIGSRSRQAPGKSVEHLTNSSGEIANGRDLIDRRKLQACCKFELRLAFGLRTQGHDDVMVIGIRSVAIALSDV
jgi:hypothetical protein